MNLVKRKLKISHLFFLEQLLEHFWETSSQMSSEEERDFFQRWLTVREDKIRQVASTSSTFIVDLLIDLTQFYNENESVDAQKPY